MDMYKYYYYCNYWLKQKKNCFYNPCLYMHKYKPIPSHHVNLLLVFFQSQKIIIYSVLIKCKCTYEIYYNCY